MIEQAHGPGQCACCSQAISGQQSLDELAFLKSACAAAQKGDVSKLERILHDHPTAIADDGVGGVSAAGSPAARHGCHVSPSLAYACCRRHDLSACRAERLHAVVVRCACRPFGHSANTPCAR